MSEYLSHTFENSFIATYVNPPGIMRFDIIDMADLDLKEVQAMHSLSKEFTKGEKYCSIFVSGPMVSVSNEAKKWGSTPEVHKNLIAQAIVINSLAHRIMGNFIIQFYKSPTETKLFNSEAEAMNWLKSKMKA